MKVIANREQLLKTFMAAASVAPQKSAKEILTNVKLTADMAGVVLQANDMEIWISASSEGCEVQHPGEVLLPVSRMGLILKECPDETITIEDIGTELVVSSRSGKFNLPIANPQEFPSQSQVTGSAYHTMSVSALMSMIKRTAYATDPDSNRYALGGVLLILDGDQVKMIGTDGRRLCHAFGGGKAVGGHKTEGHSTIIPVRTARVLTRLFTDPKLADKELRITVTMNDITFETEGVIVHSRLVEGRYPNWQQVIPKKEDWALDTEVVAGMLDSVIRQASITADVETRGIDFEMVDGSLKASAKTATAGNSKISMPIAYNGDPLLVKLDFRYLRDFLAVHDPSGSIRMRANSSTESVLLSSDGCEYVVMPMALER